MLSDALERHARVGRILKDVLSSKEGPTPSESKEHGKQLREEVPFEAHAAWLAPDSRTDPVELLLSQDETRVPSLVSLRHERMAVSPFTFYRGAALVMASDLSHTLDGPHGASVRRRAYRQLRHVPLAGGTHRLRHQRL